MQRRRRLEEDQSLLKSLQRRADDLGVLLEWANAGEDVTADFARGLDELQQEVETAETKKMLGGEYDRSNAIVTIHPGAGGTESQDWAEMLLRMYLKWAERRGLKREIIDYQPGEEAGIKSATFMLSGDYALRADGGRGGRASPRAYLAVRSGGAPPHVVRLGVRLAGAARGRGRRASTRRICAWTRIARAGRAASTST